MKMSIREPFPGLPGDMEPEGLHFSGYVSKGRSNADGEALMGTSASELEKLFISSWSWASVIV